MPSTASTTSKVSSEEQDELDQLTRDLRRVNIGDATILETNPSPGPAREEAQENFRENMLRTPVPPSASNPSDPSPRSPSSTYYGLEGSSGHRFVTSSDHTMKHLKGEGYILRRIFSNFEEADQWTHEADI